MSAGGAPGRTGTPAAGGSLAPVLAIVPVKTLDAAKSRLMEALDAADRQRLVLAMLADVLMNLRRCTAVQRVVVVTDDREARHRAVAEGADVVADEDSGSHSAAALRGIAAAAHPHDRVLLAPGDCPLVTVEDLDALLTTPQPAVVVVPDRHGTGTNALLLDPPDAIEPSFGAGSLQRHLDVASALGVAARARVVPSLALDIDTADDLATLRARFASLRGGAPATRGVVAGLRG
ncbi:MAG: 2-phospho-L-lactate guanylyltransferase [Solirubrobacteraceae bacterium]|nr:2-phospho-L-lactate guanylyltransferase [Solirubrobacteraceae bacterium]